MVVVILVVALIILIKSCLDCPGLLPSLCCGETGSEISSYHLEIVYKVNQFNLQYWQGRGGIWEVGGIVGIVKVKLMWVGG